MTTGRMIRMTMADGAEIGVYHAAPAGARRGGLVVAQEIFGITDHIRDVADGFARDGYEVLAPALFDREAPGLDAGYEGEDRAAAIALARAHPLDQSVGDVGTCVGMRSEEHTSELPSLMRKPYAVFCLKKKKKNNKQKR